jgi:hypothetical protein
MAQPHVQRASVKPPVEKVEIEQMSKEMVAVRLFTEMVTKVDEIYIAALRLENTPQLAKLLGEVGVVKVTLEGIVTQLREEDEIRKSEEALLAERAVEVENG